MARNLHNEATVLERVRVRSNNIPVRIFTLSNIKCPECGGDVDEHGAFGQVHTDTFASAVAKACVTLLSSRVSQHVVIHAEVW